MVKEYYEKYLQLGYKPSKDDLICLYKIKPAKGITMKQAAGGVAAESSIGTWTEVTTMTPKIKALGAKVFSIKGNFVKIAYPFELFELGNMPQIWSSVAGNIFNMKDIATLRLEDAQWPAKLAKSFLGPKFGIFGVRKLFRIPKRPLCGTIIKPKLGLSSKEHAKVAYQAWTGSMNIVKDDENLTSQSFNKFHERVVETLKQRDLAEKETGERKVYMPNISAETNEMLRRARFVKNCGGEYAMVDILTVGWSGLQALREANEDLRLVLHAHRAMHGAMTRNTNHGISMNFIVDCTRLVGLDQLHIGTTIGKMLETKEEVIAYQQKLKREFFGIKPVFPVCSGGLHPGLIPPLIKMLGKDIIVQAGGGVHGHPQGTKAGAMAMRQAIDAVIAGESLVEYARTHKELELAIKKWVLK
ncbi:MAG: type III ribulose-bisphosphate carboxylase [Candidatus Nanoarchaeia archaeon]